MIRSLVVSVVIAAVFSPIPAKALSIGDCKGALEPSVQGNCSGIDEVGCCDQVGRAIWCQNGNLYCVDCTDGFLHCGWYDDGYYDCGAAGPFKDPSGVHPYGCVSGCGAACGDGAVCSPACPGDCGACAEPTAICMNDGSCYEPQCKGKECGTDPLGFSCGTCEFGTECVEALGSCLPLPQPCLSDDGPGCDGCGCEACVCALYPSCCTENWDVFCAASCEFDCGFDCSPCPPDPSCDGLECGEYCGVNCGSCPETEVCYLYQCCVPQCDGKECGPNGCGGPCGECGPGDECAAGSCVECKPKCEGKVCGPDGCGGECGVCKSQGQCVEGQCVADSCLGACGGQSQFECFCDNQCLELNDCCPDFCEVCPDVCEEPEDNCNGIGWTGCCDGKVIKYCDNGELKEQDCTTDPKCGWKTGQQNYYDCGTDGAEDPSGDNPLDCSKVCQGDCEGKDCGDDGCGGSCGDCAGPSEICTDQAVCCTPVCDGKECGPGGCGGNCGECEEGLNCDGGMCIDGVPGGCQEADGPGCDGCGCEDCVVAEDSYCLETLWDALCVQYCKECGTTCPCFPDCENKTCGNDGCGGQCGECPKYEYCLDGQCELDACGGVQWEGCCDEGTLVYCDNGVLNMMSCDDDPTCGWEAEPAYYNCGTSGEADPAGLFSMSCEDYCQPQCKDKECGDDACGATCGDCADGELCVNGLCLLDECGDISYEGCCDGQSLVWCEGAALMDKKCTNLGPCGWREGQGYDCGTDGEEDPTGEFPKWCPGACQPSCEGKDCGGDGCDGFCGLCRADETCTTEGLCQAPQPESGQPDILVDTTLASDVGGDVMVQADDGGETPPKSKSGCSTGTGRPSPLTAGLLLTVLLLGLALLRRGVTSRKKGTLVALAAIVLVGCSNGTGKTDVAFYPDVQDTRVDDTQPVADIIKDIRVDSPQTVDVQEIAAEAETIEVVDDVVPETTAPDVIETTDGGGEVEVVEPPFDCDHIPPGPFELELVPGVMASEDIAFDGKGNAVGSDNVHIYKTSPLGVKKMFSPNLKFRAGLAYLPNGWLVVCDNELGRLVKIDPKGVQYTLLQGLSYPNGITIDLQGFVYVSEHDAGKVLRVHPYTGEFTVIAKGLQNPNGLAFNKEYDQLYIGTFGGSWIYRLSISPNGTPGKLVKWGDMTGSPGMLDGIAVDICGNVYVCEYASTDIWRFGPDGGAPEKILDSDPDITYLPNLRFGRGPGWDQNSLYSPDGWNKKGIWRINIGVPSVPLPFP